MGIILTSRYALAAVDGTAATTEFQFVCRGIPCGCPGRAWVCRSGVGVPVGRGCAGRVWVGRSGVAAQGGHKTRPYQLI